MLLQCSLSNATQVAKYCPLPVTFHAANETLTTIQNSTSVIQDVFHNAIVHVEPKVTTFYQRFIQYGESVLLSTSETITPYIEQATTSIQAMTKEVMNNPDTYIKPVFSTLCKVTVGYCAIKALKTIIDTIEDPEEGEGFGKAAAYVVVGGAYALIGEII